MTTFNENSQIQWLFYLVIWVFNVFSVDLEQRKAPPRNDSILPNTLKGSVFVQVVPIGRKSVMAELYLVPVPKICNLLYLRILDRGNKIEWTQLKNRARK